MKPKVALLVAVVLLLVGAGAHYYPRGTSASEAAALAADAVPTNAQIRETFLTYVPPGEPGAPHDMEWLVEHSAGDGGYYGTKYFPGSLSVQYDDLSFIQHYKISQSMNGNGQVTTTRKPDYKIYLYKNRLWQVDWSVLGVPYNFFLFQPPSGKTWSLVPENGYGQSVLSFGA